MIPQLAVATIVLWHSYHADEQRGVETAVVRWNALHPESPVEPQAIPVEGFAGKLQAAIPRGHGPDVFIAAHEKIGDWARGKLIAPIDLDTSGFLPGTVDALRLDGAGPLYGVPLAFKSVALFYRTDQVSAPPSTTDELFALCTKVKTPNHWCLAYEAGSFYHHAGWVHGEGGVILREGASQLASPEGVRALAFVRRLVDEGVIPDETSGTVVTELFNSGRAALAINGPWFLGDIRDGVPFAIAPLPIMSDTGKRAAPLLTVEAAMIPPSAAHPVEALAFARWLAGPEGAHIRATIGRQPVTDASTWSDPAIASDPRLAPFRKQLDYAAPMPNAPAMQAVWEPAQQALRRVLRGAAEPRAALTEADRRVAIALRPPPPEASSTPFTIGAVLLSAIIAAWMIRKLRATSVERSISRASAWPYLAPAMLAMLVLVFIPFAVGVGMSVYFHDGVEWRFVGLRNFIDILGARDFPVTDPLSFYFTLVVTALWTVVNVALHVLIGASLALLLRDPLLRLRAVYRVLLIVPWAVPNYITALIWKGMFHRQFGAINGLLKLLGLTPVSWFSQFSTAFAANVTTNVWLGFPFMMVVTLGALGNIPKELEEAAALDGATRWQRLRHVVMPLLGPALLPAVILGAVWTFNMFNIVFLVSGGEPDGATDILVSQAYRWAFTRGHRYGYAAAYAVLIFVVLVGQSILARRISPTREED